MTSPRIAFAVLGRFKRPNAAKVAEQAFAYSPHPPSA
jgi:hypothetical protein